MADALGARITIWVALIVHVIALLLFATGGGFVMSLITGAIYGFGYAGMSPLRSFRYRWPLEIGLLGRLMASCVWLNYLW